jgi:hypothetical protein
MMLLPLVLSGLALGLLGAGEEEQVIIEGTETGKSGQVGIFHSMFSGRALGGPLLVMPVRLKTLS